MGEKLFRTWEFPRSGSKAKNGEKKRRNTLGTAGGPGGRDRTLAVKSRKTAGKNQLFFVKKIKFTHISSSYTKILGQNYFAHGSFPEVGQKQKTEKKKRERERERKKD